MRNFLLSIFIFSLILSFCPIKAEETEKIAKNKEFYHGIDNFIKTEMKKSNADPEKGRYHFVVALSTSHFSSDQQNAIAMKQAACLIANNICTAYDSISSVAWELDVWDTSATFQLSEDGKERREFVSALPKTPMDQSEGGHDTYKSLITILKKLEHPESSIIVLITNSHESRGPIGKHHPIIGKNSEELKTILKEKGFREPIDNSFSLIFEGNDKPAEIFITLALPKDLKSQNNDSENRYPSFPYSTWVPDDSKPDKEVLPEPVKEDPVKPVPQTTTEQPTTEENKGSLPIVPIAIGAAVVLVGIIFAVMPKNKKANVKKGNTHKITFTFADVDYDPEIEDGKTNEIMFFDDAFVIKVKGEENPDEPIPEDAKSVFEVSYSNGDDSFIFLFNEGNVTSDQSELGDIEQMGDKKYMIKNGVAGSLMIDFNGNDYTLIIG